MLDRHSSVPVYIQIQRIIKSAIASGKLSPGDVVPSELSLSKEYGISRATVQKALDRLVLDGTLYRIHGKGTFVARQKNYQAFPLLFSFEKSLRQLGHTVKSAVLSCLVVKADDDAAHFLNLSAGASVIELVRLLSVDEEPSLVHTAFLEYPRFAEVLKTNFERKSLTEVLEEVAGCRITGSRSYITSGAANAYVAKLLKIREGNPILELSEVAYTKEGEPLRYTRGVFRADRFRLVAEKSGQPDVVMEYRPVND